MIVMGNMLITGSILMTTSSGQWVDYFTGENRVWVYNEWHRNNISGKAFQQPLIRNRLWPSPNTPQLFLNNKSSVEYRGYEGHKS